METTFTQLLMSSSERETFAQFSFTDREELLEYLFKHRLLLLVDWKGEEEDWQIGNFLQKRTRALFGEPLSVHEPYSKLIAEVKNGRMVVGDSVTFLLKQFKAQLKKIGLTIVLLELGNDSYYLGLMKQTDIDKLKKQTDIAWKFVVFGNSRGEVLYTVNCECGSTNVWQVKRGEIITDDTCQDCERQLFDANGNCPFKVIKDYI
ncbi:DUF6630 family protein [Chitinophaga polysaccharea]|uniref:DUF6630 family protein n=1 Tax=Chitinophaga polysaccharea TaxID=1293035 RepID=UPI00115B48A5|nr:hypothetical protein [Chitinophaga polysaccharea]